MERSSFTLRSLIAMLALSCLFTSCATTREHRFPNARWFQDHDTSPIKKPRSTEQYRYPDPIEKHVFHEVERLLDFPRLIRGAGSHANISTRHEAMNANRFDEVGDSSWFTNRIGRRDMSAAEIARGPNKGTGPLMSKPWTVVSAKVHGVTPGFVVKDGRGDYYILKFDPSGHQELASGAEMISTKILHAVGYHVPENYIVTFSRDQLRLSEKATTRDKYGNKARFMPISFDRLLGRIAKWKPHTYRALASKFLDGKPIGPFPMRGRRYKDTNDRIPHEHRRELRGYRIFASYLNHPDSREANTLDTFHQTESDGRGYVRHNLLDFGATLGSASYGPRPQEHLYDYNFNYAKVGGGLLALGAYTPYWEKAVSSESPGVGFFESKLFEPLKWRPSYLNPAFDRATMRDGFWATKLLLKLHDDDLKAIVDTAEYTEPETSAYILRILRERRDKIGRAWFAHVSPLDDFRLDEDILNFNDLAVLAQLNDASEMNYRWRLRLGNAKRILTDWKEVEGTNIDLRNIPSRVQNIYGEKPRRISIEISSQRSGDFPKPAVHVLMDVMPSMKMNLVGIIRTSRKSSKK